MEELKSPLTKEEIDVMLESLDLWINEPAMKRLQKSVMGNMMMGSADQIGEMLGAKINPEGMDKFKDYFENDLKDLDKEIKRRNELGTLLKAKLIMLKQEMDIKKMSDNSNQNTDDKNGS